MAGSTLGSHLSRTFLEHAGTWFWAIRDSVAWHVEEERLRSENSDLSSPIRQISSGSVISVRRGVS